MNEFAQYNFDPSIQYDVVPLPSNGIYYANKKKSVRVSYLTAADENILSSQNLISANLVIDELLKRKIMDKDIDVSELVEDDRQIILIFLRNTAYGSEYKLTATDPKTNLPFTVDFDLGTVKSKDFNLIENEKGEYTYHLPLSKKTLTFNFLTRKQEKILEETKTKWNGPISPYETQKLEFLIKSIDGNRDEMVLYNFIQSMPIKESQDFKKFIEDNKPGLDLTTTIETPSKEKIQINIGLGVEFFRKFYGL